MEAGGVKDKGGRPNGVGDRTITQMKDDGTSDQSGSSKGEK